MKVNRDITRKLAAVANIGNMVNGGSVYPSFETSRESDHLRLEMTVPSVSPEDLRIEVNNHALLIFQTLRLHDQEVPNLMGVFQLSGNVMLDEISAGYEDQLLVIKIPLSGFAGGFRRQIEIQRGLS